MATKKTTKKTVKKAPAKKTAAKKAPAKKAAAKKTTTKKTAAKKVAPVKDALFHLYDEGGKKFVPADKAKAVKVPGFDDFQFFLHKSADGKGWTISEASSGGRISVGRTQKEAKEKAAEALGKHGQEDLAESIKRSIARNGTAPGFEDAAKDTAKKTFSVTTDDGTEVEVTIDAEFRNHLEFRGEISPTGYRSHFGYDGKGRPEDAARKIANDLRAEFLKEQAKQARKGKKQPKDAPKVTTRLKSKILAALVDDKKLPRSSASTRNNAQNAGDNADQPFPRRRDNASGGSPQVHFDDIVEATGASVGDVAATLMVLELDRKVKSLPGKFYRVESCQPGSGLDTQKRAQRGKAHDSKLAASNRDSASRGTRPKEKAVQSAAKGTGKGGKPKGKMSMLDAAAEVLKGAKEPLGVKDITRRIFEQDLSASDGRTPHATLSAAMGREIKARGAESRFRRTGRGLFELNA